MLRTLRRVAIPAAALLLAAAGCSSTASTGNSQPTTPPSSPTTPSTTGPASPSAPSTTTAPSQAPTTAAQIVIDNFAFSPANLTVHPGQSITVVNHDSTTHTLTAGSGGAFDTGAINPGKSATITAPATAGTYPYVCSIHASMHGTLTVG
ncbi:blue (type 1) copper domain protein [Catenulispora acidiphila DSM 44928]|uniref:Blue (Type 1) copper domain protein n=1 Tax=Catenulispora acidiphila (strain DSM 44928 / JCM 14897 / NBRC 102108 / NRRL B-24433 / ID139908) TaxID=479433 RepID=C7QET2_CATAD|nr:cupredoxin domain-containing protein [Catenulispora acidiphila]ACU72852.1 blue (type 1) copper domain protein [Catenulispora acidiphila DSM 44928]